MTTEIDTRLKKLQDEMDKITIERTDLLRLKANELNSKITFLKFQSEFQQIFNDSKYILQNGECKEILLPRPKLIKPRQGIAKIIPQKNHCLRSWSEWIWIVNHIGRALNNGKNCFPARQKPIHIMN